VQPPIALECYEKRQFLDNFIRGAFGGKLAKGIGFATKKL